MANLDALITLLASQFRDLPHLRDALIQTMLSVLAEEQQPQAAPAREPNYFELLKQLHEQQVQAIKTGHTQTERALHELAETIRADLQQTALALHASLRAGQFQPDSSLEQRVGIALDDFPVGFPQDINLLAASNRYLQLTRDLNVMTRYFSQQRFTVSQHIRHEQQQAARWLQDVALEALASSQHIERLKFYRQCRTILQNRRLEAEDKILALLQNNEPQHISQHVAQMESWLQQYGSLGRNILKNLSSVTHRTSLLSLLIRTRDYSGLKALIEREPVGKGEKDFFETLMLLRFGEEYQKSAYAWKNWLTKRIDESMHKTRAVAFWKTHSEALPILLAETMLFSGLEAPDIPATLQAEYVDFIGHSPIQSFLERWRSELSLEEIQHLERSISEPAFVPSLLPAETEFSFDEVQVEAENAGISASKDAGDPELPPSVLEGAIETAVDAALEGNLVESTLISILDKGSEAVGGQFTVTIDEDEETSVAPPAEQPRYFRRKKKPKAPPKEPEERIWHDHIFPFIRANLVFVLAPSLIFVGLLLLVLTLWDKAVWIRYGVTPCMLVSVSYALSRIGLWLKGEDIQNDSSIAIMQSVAILLAPLSLLFVALLSVDKHLTVSVRVLWGVFLAVALLLAWGGAWLAGRRPTDTHTFSTSRQPEILDRQANTEQISFHNRMPPQYMGATSLTVTSNAQIKGCIHNTFQLEATIKCCTFTTVIFGGAGILSLKHHLD